jgi:hypothetical protein
MSFSVVNKAWEVRNISPIQKLLLVKLADHANENHIGWPSIERLKDDCCCSRATVFRALKDLEKMGLIQTGKKDGKNNLYTVLKNPVPEDKRVSQRDPNFLTYRSHSETQNRSHAETHAPLYIEPPVKNPQYPYNPQGDSPPKNMIQPDLSSDTQGRGQNNSVPEKITAEMIYAAYPKKVGRPAGLRAISSAMKRHSPEEILRLTKEFADQVSRLGITPKHPRFQFIKHPQGWFSQERFADDPTTWTEHLEDKPKPKPAESPPEAPDLKQMSENYGEGVWQ